jgi:hypothetical protein
MKHVGDYVGELTHEIAAESMSDEYIICHDIYSYIIFDRETGVVMWVGEEGLLGAEGYRAARQAQEVMK